jgi:hypothetical protein
METVLGCNNSQRAGNSSLVLQNAVWQLKYDLLYTQLHRKVAVPLSAHCLTKWICSPA